MAFLNNNFDVSISKDSVFDWGNASEASLKSSGDYSRRTSAGSSTTSVKGVRKNRLNGTDYVNRYNPSNMDLGDNIDDLIEDCSSSNSDSELCDAQVSSTPDIENNEKQSDKKVGIKKYGPGGRGNKPKVCFRQLLVITSLIVIIIGASLAIGYLVVVSDDDPIANNISQPQKQQQLLEMAERVVTACSENNLNDSIVDCQQLCHSRMCCFHDESDSKYSCNEDESKECAVYAGCEALLGGIPMGSDVDMEDEE